MFPHDTFPSRGIKDADDRFKKKAMKFVEKIKAGGGTPISGAIEHAFDKIVIKYNIDTIYLLSDGAPSKPANEVRQLINDRNSDLYVKIHCVSIGADSDFLKKVAADHKGDYWQAQ